MTRTWALEAETPAAESGTASFAMHEAAFREFYDQTARQLKRYLVRMVSNDALADDLLQEAYFRLLRVQHAPEEAGQRKAYLFRIATNLARDHFRSRKFQAEPLEERTVVAESKDSNLSTDMRRLLGQLPPRDRELLLLAYVEGASHREIAAMTGVKEASVRPLLFRVRQKAASTLRQWGFEGGSAQ
jgi:RNA polymerase sigma-70 factor, ECF subfamily